MSTQKHTPIIPDEEVKQEASSDLFQGADSKDFMNYPRFLDNVAKSLGLIVNSYTITNFENSAGIVVSKISLNAYNAERGYTGKPLVFSLEQWEWAEALSLKIGILNSRNLDLESQVVLLEAKNIAQESVIDAQAATAKDLREVYIRKLYSEV